MSYIQYFFWTLIYKKYGIISYIQIMTINSKIFIFFLLKRWYYITLKSIFLLKGDIMKKLISLLLVFTLSFGLIACKPTPVREPVDCDLYPTHVDCLEDEDPTVDCETDPDNELCETEEPTDFIDIYYINDFHGAILPDSDKLGMAYIANFLVTKIPLRKKKTD